MNLVPRKNIHRDVFGELFDIHRDLNDLFDFSWVRRNAGGAASPDVLWGPVVDISEEKDRLIVKADIPGLKKEDIQATLHDNTLTLRGEKKESEDTAQKGYLRRERFYGTFERVIELPAVVDEAKVKATYKDGVLELVLPKRTNVQEQHKRLSIE